MEIKHAQILSVLVFIILCFSLHKLFTIYDRKQQLEESQLAQKALYIEIMEQRASDSIKGGEFFKRNCTQCHPGPNRKHFKLDKILKKLGNEYFVEFVMNEDSLLEAEDPQTIWINKIYNAGNYMHKFSMNENEINQLIEYLK